MVKRRGKVKIDGAYGDKNSPIWCEQEPLKAYAWAKEAWLSGETKEVIWRRTGFPEWRLNSWIYGYDETDTPEEDRGGWTKVRDRLEHDVFKAVYKTEKERYHRVLDQFLTAAERGIRHINASNAEISPRDISSLTSAAKVLYEMIQLEQGKPTAITGRAKVTRADVLKKLQQNDLISYEPEEKKDVVN